MQSKNGHAFPVCPAYHKRLRNMSANMAPLPGHDSANRTEIHLLNWFHVTGNRNEILLCCTSRNVTCSHKSLLKITRDSQKYYFRAGKMIWALKLRRRVVVKWFQHKVNLFCFYSRTRLTLCLNYELAVTQTYFMRVFSFSCNGLLLSPLYTKNTR